MANQIDDIFESSMRVSSAPVTTEKRAKSASRAKPKMNGVFQIPETTRSTKSTAHTRAKSARSPRPAWSQVPPKKSANPPKKSTRVEKKVNGEVMSKTRIISKRSPGSKAGLPNGFVRGFFSAQFLPRIF